MNVKEQLKETSQQLQSLISSVPGGIGIFELKDANLSYRYFNDGLAALLGYTHAEYAELIEQTAVAMVYPQDLPVLMKVVADIVSNPHPNDSTTCEFRMIKKDQTLAWIFLSASIMAIESDGIVFSAVFTDITDLKTAQKHVEEKNNELLYHSEHDYLTGLYNREKFCSVVEKVLKENASQEYAIIRFDIERFKMINELFGSEIGDKVLCCIADMLRQEVRSDGVYCRLEADHFALCMKKEDLDMEKMLGMALSQSWITISGIVCASILQMGLPKRSMLYLCLSMFPGLTCSYRICASGLLIWWMGMGWTIL